MKLLALSTSLLTDRMLCFSEFGEVCSRGGELHVWTDAADPAVWASGRACVERFPVVEEFPGLYTRLRRLNEATWDQAEPTSSRSSMARWSRGSHRHLYRTVVAPARALARVRAHRQLERQVERLLVRRERSPQATERLTTLCPDVVLTMSPFRLAEPGVVASAKRLRIPTIAFITSWDNLSTKNRMPIHHDGYAVWSEWMKAELLERYPHAQAVPIRTVGAPQFDVFFQPQWRMSRDEFLRAEGLRPDLPLIVYALGSPNFLREVHGARDLGRRLSRGRLGEVQLLVRPHPVFDHEALEEAFDGISAHVVVQHSASRGVGRARRTQAPEQIVRWVNTFAHADVVVNLSSTAAIDAAILDRPVVNLNYDPSPGARDDALIKEINSVWSHFAAVVETGALRMTQDADDTEQAVLHYLKNPESDAEERARAVKLVCGRADGKAGRRLGDALVEFAQAGRAR